MKLYLFTYIHLFVTLKYHSFITYQLGVAREKKCEEKKLKKKISNLSQPFLTPPGHPCVSTIHFSPFGPSVQAAAGYGQHIYIRISCFIIQIYTHLYRRIYLCINISTSEYIFINLSLSLHQNTYIPISIKAYAHSYIRLFLYLKISQSLFQNL